MPIRISLLPKHVSNTSYQINELYFCISSEIDYIALSSQAFHAPCISKIQYSQDIFSYGYFGRRQNPFPLNNPTIVNTIKWTTCLVLFLLHTCYALTTALILHISILSIDASTLRSTTNTFDALLWCLVICGFDADKLQITFFMHVH